MGYWSTPERRDYLFRIKSFPEPGFGLEATNRAMFLQRARDKGIRMTPLTEVLSIDATGVTVRDILTGGERRIEPLDVVVPVWPRASRDDLYFELLDRLEATDGPRPEILRIGDASAPRLIQTVMLEAHQKAMVL